MASFDERRLRFNFGDPWRVLKWDREAPYKNVIGKLQHTMAVDFVALNRDESSLLLVEVKDFRGHRIENKRRLSNGELRLEVAHKVRDTLAGLIAARRSPIYSDQVKDFADALLSKQRKIHVLLWMEQDLPGPDEEAKTRASEFALELALVLRWLNPRVLVENLRTGSGLPGLNVTSLSRERNE